jgi:hypothetical protein
MRGWESGNLPLNPKAGCSLDGTELESSHGTLRMKLGLGNTEQV